MSISISNRIGENHANQTSNSPPDTLANLFLARMAKLAQRMHKPE
jgi:hypothetical protein